MSAKGHPDHATQAEHDAWEGGYEAGMTDGYVAGMRAALDFVAKQIQDRTEQEQE